jgi:fucose 4-O-acetylase-like acetyltransferase
MKPETAVAQGKTAQENRQLWPDWAKGLGIILVVAGHVWRGLMAAGLPIAPDLYATVDRLIYAFHMPLFFLLSGLFFEAGMLRRPVPVFLWSRVVFLLWPLAVWTWIFFLSKSVTGNLVNAPVVWSDFPLFPLPPREEFWFFWALFLIQVVLTLCLRPVVRHPSLRNAGWLVAYGIALALAILTPGVAQLGPWIIGAYLYASYFILGVLLSRQLLGRGLQVPLILSLMGFAAFEALGLIWPVSTAGDLLIGTGAALAVTLGVRSFEQIGTLNPIRAVAGRLGWLALLGTRSGVIYVVHVQFTAATRIVLMKLGITAIPVHLGLAVLAGLLGPLIVFEGLRRLRLAALFGLRSA